MNTVRTASNRALLLEADEQDAARGLLVALKDAQLAGVTELVPGARTILVHFDPSLISAATLQRQLQSIRPAELQCGHAEPVIIPVRYDGEDLREAAALLAVTVDELVARHQRARWSVAFAGFAPGFGYLVGDDPLFDVVRRASPRTRIPAGSVALAGRFSGVYPRESPGGWQLIGRTDAALWDATRTPPALLQPGTPVRFEAVERALNFAAAKHTSCAIDPLKRVSGPHIEVVNPGLQLVVQDFGRPGMASQGVSSSGAADRGAMRAANRSVGNHPGSAVLESTGGGATLVFHADTVVAVTGALVSIRRGGREVSANRPFAVEPGDEVQIGQVRRGLRVTIAVRGGVTPDAELGSRATDTLSGLGPAPLQAGHFVPIGDRSSGPYAVEASQACGLPKPGETVELDIVLGPRDDWFTESAVSTLTGAEWEVTPQSDRVGIRLSGPPLKRSRGGELESEGIATGAIQVPNDGQPLIFLSDHPLTGGYPVIASVHERHLDLAGQLPPGVRLRFRVVASTSLGA